MLRLSSAASFNKLLSPAETESLKHSAMRFEQRRNEEKNLSSYLQQVLAALCFLLCSSQSCSVLNWPLEGGGELHLLWVQLICFSLFGVKHVFMNNTVENRATVTKHRKPLCFRYISLMQSLLLMLLQSFFRRNIWIALVWCDLFL